MDNPGKSSLHKGLSNKQLLKEWEIVQAAQRDAAEFRPLYERYYVPIFRLVLRRTENEEIASELCSLVFFKALEKIGRYTYKGVPFSAWLYRIASNEVTQFFREKKRGRVISLDVLQLKDIAEEVEETFDEDKQKIMLEALQDLREKDLQMVELRFFEQRSFKEIAQIMEITENNAKVRTYRILEKIRKKF
ncbi:MAG: sigma-70 family RNA polymerase sigma factor [Saprospiraceae bacterium]|nr:sigma-70 family RNA polymerase sigma factor [Saprospiraceae bacterium]